MNEQTKNEGQTGAQTQPEDNGAGGKTFTQEEVNKIVSERLARERAKQEPDPAAEALAQRERDLAARENKAACTEFIREGGYEPVFLEVLDTSDPEGFKAKVKKLCSEVPGLDPKSPRFRFTGPVNSNGSKPFSNDPIAQAFGRK